MRRRAFQSYVSQDNYYLTSFAKAYTAALPKAAAISEVRLPREDCIDSDNCPGIYVH